ncbi:MAG: TonB-dependent receptor [Saprospiraceae bacterium]
MSNSKREKAELELDPILLKINNNNLNNEIMKFSRLQMYLGGFLLLFGPPLMANGSVEEAPQIRPIVEILEEISKEYQVFFSYEVELLSEIQVDFHTEQGEDLNSAIDRLLDKVDLQYKTIGEKYYVIHKKGKKGRKSMKKIERKLEQIQKLEDKGHLSLQRNEEALDPIQKLTDISKTIVALKTFITVKGTIVDANGDPIIGANVLEKGTTNGAITGLDGSYSINTSNENSILVFSYIGYETQEVVVGNQSIINITLQDDISLIDEVIVVGYGTQKKVNLTAAVSQVGEEFLNNRPTANAAQSLQGVVPGLVITNSSTGGEPGTSPNINIRGFLTSGGTGAIQDSGPLVLVDGLEMSLNDIDPEDIESVSVLKDAAAASIYGSRAAGGAILVTTKSGKNMQGKTRVNYSNNFSFSRPTIWPKNASPIDFAYAVNDARRNNRQNPYHDETDLANIMANMANPGSAPTISPNGAGTNWSYGSIGIDGTAATDWEEVIFNDWATRSKHNLSLSGGNEQVNYYLSAGAYDEGGLLAVGDESFQRYNLDAKISTKATDWLTLELLVKMRKSYTDFPTETNNNTVAWNKSRVLDLVSKLKPGLPLVDPIYGSDLMQHAYFPFWSGQRAKTENNQTALLPRIIIEPIKNLKFNAYLNYRRDNNFQEIVIQSSQIIRPQGLVDRIPQASTRYRPTFIENEYFSPNLFATYEGSVGKHNFHGTAGYQSELNEFRSIGADTDYLISDNVVSLNSSLDDDQLVNESITHWAVQSIFSRFRYNFDEKYLFEISYRRDGSSRFAPDNRWAGFASYSAGYNIAKEAFWPIEAINTFKLRASYGTLGNQNVGNYLYLSNINLNTAGTSYLFDGNRETFALTPGITSENLTWERVKTTDIGFDLGVYDDKLNVGFSWYRTEIDGMAAQGVDLPAQLGTGAPLTNIGASRIQGWEVEALWQDRIGDFGYNIRAVVSDYQRTIIDYPNETNSLTQNFVGQDLGDIYGLTWDGWFATDDEYAEYPIDQSFVNGNFWTGDTKYKDLNGDEVINRGEWVVDDTGDFSVIGNSTPRYQFSVNLGLNYKNFDFNALIQGVGKRDVLLSNHQRFRGPGQGPFHINVWEEHLDYYRPEDTESPLGPNTDAYFPSPYTANPGRNNRNYRFPVDRYIQNGAYARLKSLQIGYTLPQTLLNKVNINSFRVFVTGENLFTVSDLMFFDPEVVTSNVAGSAQSYPLSQIISFGLNLSF